MTQAEGLNAPRKLLAGRAVKLRIAFASVLFLAVGVWLTPPAAQTPLSASQERPAPLLEEQVQRTEAARTFVGVQGVAAGVLDQIVAIPMSTPVVQRSQNDFSNTARAADAAGFGVFVADGYVLTHSAALAGRSSVTLAAGERTLAGRVAVYEPSTGLVLLQTDRSGGPAARMSSQTPAAGALTVGVGRSRSRDVTVPIFITSVGQDHYVVGAVSGFIPPGLPVFTLAGELLAIAIPGESAPSAVPVKAAADRLLARVSSGERQLALGLGVQSASDVTAIFGERGVIVTDVLEGGPADAAELQVGDVLLAIDDVAVDAPDAMTRAMASSEPQTPRRLRYTRAGRIRDTTVTPALAFDIATLGNARPNRPGGPEARAVFDAAFLEMEAIPPTARVLAMNGRAVTSRAQVQRERRVRRVPISVLLRHDNQQFFIALQPGR